MQQETGALLAERGKTHGPYIKDAQSAMGVIQVVMACPNWGTLAADQKHALIMIGVKLGRIMNGDPDHEDHWRDIAGYATLVADQLKTPGPTNTGKSTVFNPSAQTASALVQKGVELYSSR